MSHTDDDSMNARREDSAAAKFVMSFMVVRQQLHSNLLYIHTFILEEPHIINLLFFTRQAVPLKNDFIL